MSIDGVALAPGQEWFVSIGPDVIHVELVAPCVGGRSWRGLTSDGTLHVLPVDDPNIEWAPRPDDMVIDVDVDVVLEELHGAKEAVDVLAHALHRLDDQGLVARGGRGAVEKLYGHITALRALLYE